MVMLYYDAKSNGSVNAELYGIVDAKDNWVVQPCLPNFVGACALAERMNLCAQLEAGEIHLTVPVMARLGISPEAFEDFRVYS